MDCEGREIINKKRKRSKSDDDRNRGKREGKGEGWERCKEEEDIMGEEMAGKGQREKMRAKNGRMMMEREEAKEIE